MSKKLFKLFIIMFISLFTITNVYADEYPDDIYDGDYSLYEMLENYNVITFGKKELDSQMIHNNFSKGDAFLFHINSQFLINGKLDVTRVDLRINDENLKSYAKTYPKLGYSGNSYGFFACGYYNENNRNYSCNLTENTISNYLYSSFSADIYACWKYHCPSSNASTKAGYYMNFDRLYDVITTEQNTIKSGKNISYDDRIAHVEIGGEYYIDDINELDSIVFDNFEDNKDNLTIITINNTGSINFPKIFASENNDENSLVSTNDFMGMERPNSNYADYYVIDKYYGNIIWNIPNATYIELPSAPFIGHLVAPNADVYGPELHYAGAFLVNSLYLDGYSEAHYYPLTSTNIPERSEPEEEVKEDKIINIIKNPETGDKIFLVVILMIISIGFGAYSFMKKESRKI